MNKKVAEKPMEIRMEGYEVSKNLALHLNSVEPHLLSSKPTMGIIIIY